MLANDDIYKNVWDTKPKRVRYSVIDGKIFWTITYNIEGHDAYTLDSSDLGIHDDGWIISGEVHDDYYEWINEFVATKNGQKIWGDFEKVVYCTSLNALNDFLEYHKPFRWDYWDI